MFLILNISWQCFVYEIHVRVYVLIHIEFTLVFEESRNTCILAPA